MTLVSRLTDRLPHRREGRGEAAFDRRLVAPMVLGSVLNPVNSSIIAVSLVPIGRDLHAGPAHTAWLVSGLYLATAIGQPVVGRLVDIHGPRRLYLLGTALVGLAGVLGMLAPDLPTLVASRVLLGFGTCAGYPASMYLLRSETDRTGQDSPSGVLTVLAVANQSVAVLGPPLGGLLIGLAGWRSTLAVNVPLSLACMVLGARRLPRARPAATGAARVDLLGIGLFATALVATLLFLTEPSWPAAWLLLLGACAAVGFVVAERRRDDPFVDLRLLGGNLPLVATYARMLLTAVGAYTFLYGFSQWLQEGRGLSASVAGLMLLPTFAAAIVVSGTTGRRPELRGKLVVGAVVQVVALAALLALGATSPLWLVLVVTAVLGIPQGLLNLANQNALYHQAEPERMGSSAGLLRTSMYVGAIVASALNGVFLGERADTTGLHDLAGCAVGVGLVLLVLTLVDPSLRGLGRPGRPGRSRRAGVVPDNEEASCH